MSLQSLTINRISSTVGFSRVLSVLEKILKYLNPYEAFHIENLIIYYSVIRETSIDVEADSVLFKNQALLIIDILERHKNQFNFDVINLLVDIISQNLKHVSNVRNIG